MMFSKVRVLALASAVAAVHSTAMADTVTLAPPEGVTTNVLSLFTGNTAVEVAGPSAVKLNPSNMHTGGTTLSGGTLILTGDIPAGRSSPVGTGTFTVSGGTLRGTGTFCGDITGTKAFTIEAPNGWALSGNNSFTEPVTIADGSLEISGGTSTFTGNLQFANASGEPVRYRQTGGEVSIGGNLQLAYAGGTVSEFTMTGGTLNSVNRKNATVYKGSGSDGGSSTISISGTASARNFAVIYIHKNVGTGSLTVNVRDGGTLGFGTTFQANSSTTSSFVMNIDGGSLANDSTSSADYFAWITNNVNGLTVGSGGATFLGGTSTACAQIMCPISAVVAESGETPKGVTFDGGNWGYYSDSIAYEGPTVLKNGAKLILPKAGSIPTGSAVTVGSGCELRVGNTAKTVSSLALENDAVLAFSSTLKALTVSDALTLPSRAKIALYNANTPTTTAKNTNGSYAVLKVPASYADALRAVSWSCATATSGKSYTFSVATSGETATLSMTIAADSSGAITGTSNLKADDYSVDSNITINNSGTLVAKKNIYGSATGGSININDGGTLDASSGNIRPVDASGNSFHLYLNEGGTLVVNQISGVTSGAAANEAQATAMFHFNGGTIYPLAFGPSDANRYLLNYQTAVVGANGLTIDMSKWIRPEDYTKWVRSSLQGKVNHDPACTGADGGITVKATGDERALVCFGSRFAGSTLTGGIHVEDGGIVAPNAAAFGGLALVLEPGARFRPYDNNTVNIGNLTIGANGASKAVRLDLPTKSVSAPGVAVSGTLSVLSPVEVAFTGNWNDDSTVPAGVYTALVYQAASPALGTSLFKAPPGFSISSETVAINTGAYSGYTALVLTLAQDDLSLDDSAEKTISADATYGDIYVGDSGTTADKSLLVSGGTITAGALHLAHTPVDGADSSDKHVATYTQSGGEVSVTTLRSMYRGSNSQSGRVSAEITLNGGSLSVAGDAQLGFNQTRQGYTTTITVKDGAAMSVGGNLTLTYYSGAQMAPQGILNVNGGSLTVAGDIDLSRCTNNVGATFIQDGGVFLRGGVLSAANIVQTADYTPVQRLVFDGGTYAPIAARTMQGLTKAHVSTGGAIIDTSALPAGETYTIAQALLTDPALDGAEDGGLVKKGAGTLALSGANTYIGPTKVEAGTLVAANADALSSYVEVADGAVLDLGVSGASVARIAASGAVAGNLTVTDAIVLCDEGSILSVSGNLTLANRAAIDFGLAAGEEVPSGWTPVAAVSGEITLPDVIRARNAGDFNRCRTSVAGGVLYVRPTKTGMVLIIR